MFTDVTFVCDEQNQLNAHKLVISAFSPLLKDILLQDPQQAICIYLTEATHEVLKDILNLIYTGEVNISKSDFAERQ